MPRTALLATSLLPCALLQAPDAAAAPPPGAVAVACSDYGEVRRQLGARYGEAPVSLGLQSNGNVLQVFASARSGTWTVVSTTPAGLACVIAAGRGWEALPVASLDPGA